MTVPGVVVDVYIVAGITPRGAKGSLNPKPKTLNF